MLISLSSHSSVQQELTSFFSPSRTSSSSHFFFSCFLHLLITSPLFITLFVPRCVITFSIFILPLSFPFNLTLCFAQPPSVNLSRCHGLCLWRRVCECVCVCVRVYVCSCMAAPGPWLFWCMSSLRAHQPWLQEHRFPCGPLVPYSIHPSFHIYFPSMSFSHNNLPSIYFFSNLRKHSAPHFSKTCDFCDCFRPLNYSLTPCLTSAYQK